jgi:hypothetical protein
LKNTNSNGDYPASGCSGLGYFYSVANHGLSQEQLAFDFAILIVLPLISTLTFFLLKLSVKINKDYFMFKLFPFQWKPKKWHSLLKHDHRQRRWFFNEK